MTEPSESTPPKMKPRRHYRRWIAVIAATAIATLVGSIFLGFWPRSMFMQNPWDAIPKASPKEIAKLYEPEALRAEFSVAMPSAGARTSWGTPSLDLGAAATAQLEALGVEVARLDPCTRTTAELHSYRRDGAAAGRQAAVVWRPHP